MRAHRFIIHLEHESVLSLQSCFPSRWTANHARQTHTGTGQKGTKNLLRQYSSQLVCVRYRYDADSRLRFPRVELIIEQASWSLSLPRMTRTALVGVLRVWTSRHCDDRSNSPVASEIRWSAFGRCRITRRSRSDHEDRIEKQRLSNSRHPKNVQWGESCCAGLRFAPPLGGAATRTQVPASVGVPLISRTDRHTGKHEDQTPRSSEGLGTPWPPC